MCVFFVFLLTALGGQLAQRKGGQGETERDEYGGGRCEMLKLIIAHAGAGRRAAY